jgi:hypothetical protein
MVDSKTAWVEYPEFEGFEIEVATLARQELIGIRKSCMFQKFDRKTHQKIDELDEPKFIRKFTEATVKNWKGLKYKYLEMLIPVDISKVDPEEEMPFSIDDAVLLVSNSGDFDTWLNEVVFDLDNFRTKREGGTVAAPEKVATSSGTKTG